MTTATPRIGLVPAARLDWAPAWVIAVVAAYLAGIAVFELFAPPTGGPTLCPFRQATGVPCPGCGSTRAALALAGGDPAGAVMHNPLTIVLGLAAASWLVLRVGFARRVSLRVSPAARRFIWVAFLVVLLVNWAYVIGRH